MNIAKPLSSRPLDILYFAFFVIHLPVMFLVDLTPLYPEAVHSAVPLLRQIRGWYIETYHDRFFTDPPTWFILYLSMEAVYHVPLTVWALKALWTDNQMIPVHLLIFACQTGFTTATCIAEFLSWQDFSSAEKQGLAGLYVPYLLLSVIIGYDMFHRLKRQTLQVYTIAKKNM